MSVDASKNNIIAFNSIKFANGLDFYNKICKIYNEYFKRIFFCFNI